MSESEFDIIKTYFSSIGNTKDWLITGVGDDAAILKPIPNQQQLIAIDTLNTGIHFLPETSAIDIGYKSLAVNISDIAAMAGQPLWFTLSISLPEVDHDWLKGFADGLTDIANQFGLNLIGGDTTRGPLSITIQIAGVVPEGKALTRSGAQLNDDIYVTGYLGDAAAGLKLLQQNKKIYSQVERQLLNRLHRPTPRVNIGLSLRGVATSCIDISDGLAADLGHILESSHLGAELEREHLPFSGSLQQSGFALERQYEFAIYGGDDYELCFTAPQSMRDILDDISKQTSCQISRIGRIIHDRGLFLVDKTEKKTISKTGFDHFLSS